ncbi:zinc finger protein 782-like isoform X1 [Paralichthys olivaceus]|uniref:zinc finger protein 782-like isoform X1 n=1 Tax=Paralichthys olivaceus TaxID=8255 RepID=UPI0037528767
MAECEDEICRQHRLMAFIWKTEIQPHRKEPPQQHVCIKEEFPADLLEKNPSPDQEEPEPPQIKEEQEEHCIGLEVEQLLLKQEDDDDFLLNPTFEESDHSEPDPSDHQLLSHNSAQRQDLKELPKQHVCNEEEFSADQQLWNLERNPSLDQDEPEPPQIKEEQEELCASLEIEQLVLKQEDDDDFLLNTTFKESDQDLKALPQQHVLNEEEFPSDQQLWNLERNPGPEQEEPEPPQIKEEQEELCTSLEVEQLVLKQEDDDDLNPTFEESGHSEPDPSDYQLLYHNSTQSQDLKGDKHGHSKSVRNAKPSSEKRHHIIKKKAKGHSNLACNSTMSKTIPDTCNGKNIFQCDTCGKVYKWKSRLNIHLRVHTGEKPYFCKACGKGYTCNNSLRVHMRMHTGEKPFSCKTCGKGFAFSNSLLVHMRTHTGEKPFSCTTCGKSFMSMGGLQVHIRQHTGEKPYPCTTCGKTFGDVSVLNKHLHIHTGEKPYSCKVCGKDFRFAGDFKVHMRTHSGEKPYLCNTCGKRFAHVSNLKQHINIHTDERRYICGTCGESFLSRSDLQDHKSTHPVEKPYHCNTCGKRFGRLSTLKRHTNIHTDEKPHICGTCGKAFRLWQKLAVHIRHFHPEKRLIPLTPVGECTLMIPNLKGV